jgi:hypothetical protein
MRIVPSNTHALPPALSGFLTYVQRFDIVPGPSSDSRLLQAPDPATKMYLLRRATRSDGTRMGDIVSITQIQSYVQLLPRFGKQADVRLTKENCMEYCTEFWLNKYFEKDLYYTFDSHE